MDGLPSVDAVQAWVGGAIAVLFALVFARRMARREFALAALAAGMALMAAGMIGGLAGHPVQGPWWAAGFGVIAVWPLRWTWPIPVEHLQHATAGLAMVYMCAAMPGAGVYQPAADQLAAVHHGAGATTILDVETTTGLAFPLVGWLLASCFLLQAVGAATGWRRTKRAQPGWPRADAAIMGGGMAVMLLAVL